MTNVGKWSNAAGEEMNTCGIILVEPEDVKMNGQVCQQLTKDELESSSLTQADCEDHVKTYLNSSGTGLSCAFINFVKHMSLLTITNSTNAYVASLKRSS